MIFRSLAFGVRDLWTFYFSVSNIWPAHNFNMTPSIEYHSRSLSRPFFWSIAHCVINLIHYDYVHLFNVHHTYTHICIFAPNTVCHFKFNILGKHFKFGKMCSSKAERKKIIIIIICCSNKIDQRALGTGQLSQPLDTLNESLEWNFSSWRFAKHVLPVAQLWAFNRNTNVWRLAHAAMAI